MEETFPLYHEHQGELFPRSSGVIKSHPKSLHYKLHFGHCTDEFLDTVERTSIEGDHIHDAVRRNLNALMLNGDLKHDGFDADPDDADCVHEQLNFWERAKTRACIEWLRRENITILRPPEKTIVRPDLSYGGSPDLVCRWRGMNTVIDFKSGDKVHKVYWLQLDSYAQLIEREMGIRIHRL